MMFNPLAHTGPLNQMPDLTSSMSETMSVDDMSSEALILSVANLRSRDAYKLLFMRYAPKLKSFLMSKSLSAAEAEDMAQDTLLAVWRKAHYFDPQKASASTWIYTIARNLRIDRARKEGRAKILTEDDFYPSTLQVTADEQMILNQSANELSDHIQSLQPDQKDVLRKFFYEDLSHSQIAQCLNLPLGTVKSRLRLAMIRLRSLVGV